MLQGKTYPDWIAVDWGTTNLRAWAMQGASVLHEAKAATGMAQLSRDSFEPALMALIHNWLPDGPIDVLACGMVGARQGWAEAAYRTVPCAPLDHVLTPAAARDPRLRVRILSGLKQLSPPDVMRGEETQIAGFLSLNPNWDGVICLPGTHAKWVHVSAGEVISFQTFLTGELFDLLAKTSVLRHSLDPMGWDEGAFQDALDQTLSKPEALAARLFALRANHLLNDVDKGSAAARLSGLLIGAELAAARPYWLGQNTALVGAASLTKHYASALVTQGVQATVAESAAMTRAGLTSAYQTQKATI